MFKKILYLTATLGLALTLCSCEKHETIFDHPFIYITDGKMSGSSREDVTSDGRYTSEYTLILSSKTLKEELIVTYDLIVGDGLTEGVDFELLNPKSVVFPIGLYENVIRIKWNARRVDETKNNTIRIVLTGTNQNITLGFPGPDKNNSSFMITKFNN